MQQARLLVTMFWLGALAACGAGPNGSPAAQLQGTAMGTSFSITLVGSPTEVSLEEMRSDVERKLALIEQQMSTYIADSELSLFNAHRSADWFEVSAELCAVVAGALTLSAATDGAFDITVGSLVNLWGFGPTGPTDTPPDAELIEVLLGTTGYEALHADCAVPALRKDVPDLYIDLSAFAKGYGVDELATLLETAGVRSYLVEIGGELRVKGSNAEQDPWGIAIESPGVAERSVQSIVRLTDAAMATSGDYRNYFEHKGRKYSHTIDPRSGYPVAHSAASVTVIADSAAFADAMATALLVMGETAGIAFAEREGIAALFLVRDNDVFREIRSSAFGKWMNTT